MSCVWCFLIYAGYKKELKKKYVNKDTNRTSTVINLVEDLDYGHTLCINSFFYYCPELA
jgi:hypothetical protein